MMQHTTVARFLALFLFAAAYSGAQEYNAVPLDHDAYALIEMGVMRGIILPPGTAKPWTIHTVKEKLWEMVDDPAQILSSQEVDTVSSALDSFERTAGLDVKAGRYRRESAAGAFETGWGWESRFSLGSLDWSIASVNQAILYAGGDAGHFASWNITAQGAFLYVERSGTAVRTAFPYTAGKQWDGGVLSLYNPGEYSGWPDDPSLAYGLQAELNGVFFDDLLQMRLGRVRRDWGQGANGDSLFINAHARPFTALEAAVAPLPWLHISALGGALEHYREDYTQPDDGLFSRALAAAYASFDPLRYVHFGFGAAAASGPFDAAFFADLTLRLPGLLTLWGSVFVDQLDSSENFFIMNRNSYAYQAGIKTTVHWLPFAAFTLRYTKVEPYCYGAFSSGGESLGYYLPPNSDELLLRLESLVFPGVNAYVQFQMMRHGVDYGYGAVGGSSLRDTRNNSQFTKYFLMDGVYQWDNVVKLGSSWNLRAGGIPLSLFVETGVVAATFTINGDAGIGNEGDYEPLDNVVYASASNFIFSIGFRLFP